ncbi:MAG TPA: DUF642 domain-containing protein [Alphaproteobacteria bacterium]|nr:DUF642 domain-containing protein [Alphaproteobacteria bacterium]
MTNGSFEQTSLSTSGFLTDHDVTGWTTTSGYTFEVFQGTETTNIGNGVTFYGGTTSHGHTTFPSNPDGFRYIASDGAYETGAITQTINGLEVGAQYQLTFSQAGAQQTGYSGSTTDQWQVSLGGDTQYSDLIRNGSHKFSGWEAQTMTFTATSTSEILSFLAMGTPDGEPPFSLLDDVALEEIAPAPPPPAAPEPSTLAVMIVGLLGAIGVRKWQRRNAVS